MNAVFFMRHIWRDVYRDLRLWAQIFFLPSIIVLYSLLAVFAVVEFILLDIPWLFFISIEEGWGRLKSNIWYLSH